METLARIFVVRTGIPFGYLFAYLLLFGLTLGGVVLSILGLALKKRRPLFLVPGFIACAIGCFVVSPQALRGQELPVRQCGSLY